MWFLRKILRDIEHIRVCSIPMYMIGVGAEMEVVSAKDTVCQILAEIEHIWTRDGSTTDLLIRRLGVSPLKVTTGADLANIALKNIFSKVAPDNHRKYELAVTYYAEDVARSDIKELRNFLECISKEKSVIFVANETRKDRHFEYGIYRSMFGRLRNLYKPCPVSLFSPDYETASLPELVTHFQNYKVVMASRYHALLAAAWAGCKIVALARSSKVEHLG
jgi:polysaccharide pyruvyl transferase WcaK-like protein